MKFAQYIIACLICFIFTGCSDEGSPYFASDSEGIRLVGDKVVITGAVGVPGFKEVASRSFDETPNLNSLHLYVIEFVDNGSPLLNTLSGVYQAQDEEVANQTVLYNLTLNKTDMPRILHFVAVADDNLEIPSGGVEASVMMSLTSEKSTDAYWRRIVFPDGYCTPTTTSDGKEVWEVNDDLYSKFGMVKNGNQIEGDGIKLIRNFAKITVGVSPNPTSGNNETGFTLEGFMIVNTPQKGTMVPYSASTRSFPEFLYTEGEDKDSPLPYLTVAQTYSGISPANTLLGNQITSGDAPEIKEQNLTEYSDAEGKKWLCLPSEYIYERPFNSISRTYIIVRGTYHNKVTNPSDAPSYYKLDLGANDDNGIFKYFGILRNYNYFIRITGVHSTGYASAEAAANGTVYNNISFDIDTDHLMNMSDGSDVIRVNLTTAVITSLDSTLVFRYSYRQNILGANSGTFNNDAATFIGLEPGAVIKSVDPSDPNTAGDDPDNKPWRTVKILCEPPTNITQTQQFTIVNTSTGLGRTITFVSHLKWNFENVREFARIWENYPSTYKGLQTYNPDTDERNPHLNGGYANGTENRTYEGLCGTDAGSQFTIFFDIPDNIPEALFPLEFVIESDHQGLENEPMGTIVVTSGPSLFQNNNGEIRIQYIKSVTWTEYNSPLRMDVRDDNGTMIGNPEEGAVIHRVRCRFRTIEPVANDTHINVAIDNFNFNQTTVGFYRVDVANNLRGPGLVSN